MFDVLLKLSWHTESLSPSNYIVKSFWNQRPPLKIRIEAFVPHLPCTNPT